MKCPNCQKQFKFKEVPLNERYLKASVTIFPCIHCRILLEPGRTYKLSMNGGILLATIGICCMVFTPKMLYIGIPISVVGVILSVYGHFNLSPIIYKDIEN